MNIYLPKFGPSQYWKPWKKNDVSHVPDYPNTTAHMSKKVGQIQWDGYKSYAGPIHLNAPTIQFGGSNPKWVATINGIDDVTFTFQMAPNLFYRMIHRILLGIKWRKL